MMCRRFKGRPVSRVIATVPDDVLQQIDRLLMQHPAHPARGCMAEFVRLALAEKLGRDLMLIGAAASVVP